MDNFMDKLMNKFNAADMIKANNMAEREAVTNLMFSDDKPLSVSKENEVILEEIKKLHNRNEQLFATVDALNEKNRVVISALSDVNSKNQAVINALYSTNEKNAIVMEALAATEKNNNIIMDAIKATDRRNDLIMKAIQATDEKNSAILNGLKANGLKNDEIIGALSKVNQRNDSVFEAINGMVQQISVADDESGEIANEFSNMQQDISASNKNVKKLITDVATVYASVNKVTNKLNETIENVDKSINDTQDFMHKESVKVYRNVQAMVEEENSKLLSSIDEKFKVTRKAKIGGPVVTLIILSILVGAANLVLLLSEYFPILPFLK